MFSLLARSLLGAFCCCHKFILAKVDESAIVEELWARVGGFSVFMSLALSRWQLLWHPMSLSYDACDEGRADCRRRFGRTTSFQDKLRFGGEAARRAALRRLDSLQDVYSST